MQHISEALTHTYSRIKYVCIDKIKKNSYFGEKKNHTGLVGERMVGERRLEYSLI